MIAYKIEQNSTGTIYLTSDLMDVFDTIGAVTDGTPVLITAKELTVAEFENEVKLIAINNQTTPQS
jgi:hypothetical protein